MTSYEDALSCILANIQTLPAKELPLSACFGLTAAEDIYSPVTLPMLAAGGPDGYAARSADLAGATRENPVTLHIQETVRAGRLPKCSVKPGFAARTMTGSTTPEGADCIVRFEDTDEPGDKSGPNPAAPTAVKIFVAPKPGENILPAGHMVQAGDLVVRKGTIIGPGQISALTAIGRKRIRVVRRPVVAIFSTGDELIPSNQTLRPGKIYNSNGPALAALVAHAGGVPKFLGIARDNLASLEKQMLRAMSADVVFTSGGVSKGDFDLVRLVIAKYGRVVFNRLQMGPGASFTFGIVASQVNGSQRELPVFALAGPPTGCLINYETLARPALRKLLGYSNLRHAEVEAVALDAARNRASFNFVRWTQLTRNAGGYQVRFGAAAGPGGLSSLAFSNSLTILPQGAAIEPGDRVTVLPMDWAL